MFTMIRSSSDRSWDFEKKLLSIRKVFKMPITNYRSVNGRMLSEVTDGVILDYVPDALGSIHSVVDQTATAVKTMRYKPYGEVLSRSGSISDRMYQWVGTYGYRATFNYASSHYVRARHYSQTPGSWTTVDRFWQFYRSYSNVGGRIVSRRDQTGLAPDDPIRSICKFSLCDKLNDLKPPGSKFAELVKCMSDQGYGEPGDAERIRKVVEYLRSACSNEKSKPSFCLFLASGGQLINGLRQPADDRCGIAEACGSVPGFGPNGFAIPIKPPTITPPRDETCTKPVTGCLSSSYLDSTGRPCACVVVICADNNNGDAADRFCKKGLFHEMVHCAGLQGAPDHNGGPHNDFVYNLGCCACKVLFGKDDPSCAGCSKRR